MTERPIIFSGPMVRAILEGRKNQTRRVMRPQPKVYPGYDGYRWPVNLGTKRSHLTVASDDIGHWRSRCPYGLPGHSLWVREKWQAIHVSIDPETGYGDDVDYAKNIPKVNPADGIFARRWWSVAYATDPGWDDNIEDRGFPWRPSIHMPRWASRLTLRVTEIRVQRVQEISEEDAQAEGVEGGGTEFAALWNQINAKPGRTWEDNPWIWVIGFEQVK